MSERSFARAVSNAKLVDRKKGDAHCSLHREGGTQLQSAKQVEKRAVQGAISWFPPPPPAAALR